MRNVILFTGLPRTPQIFARSVRELSQIACVDEISFSTWEGVVEKDSDILQIIDEYDINVIQSTEPNVVGPGHIWHQMKSLEVGLESLSHNDNVLKTRTDIHIDPAFVRRLFTGEIDSLQHSAGSAVFDKRLWVPWFEIMFPFYLDDLCFFGQASDVARLYNYNGRFDAYHPPYHSTHVRRYLDPYLREFEFLDSLLQYPAEIQSGLVIPNRPALMRSRISSPVYASFLAFYYKILRNDFYITNDSVSFYREKHTELTESYASTEPLPMHSFIESFTETAPRHRGDLKCFDEAWLDAQFGDPPNSDVPPRILDGLERSFDSWREFELADDALSEDIAREQQYFSPPTKTRQLGRKMMNGVLAPLGLRDAAIDVYNLLNRK